MSDTHPYAEWAHVVVHNQFTAQYSRKYHCCYIGRKFNRNYQHSHEQVLAAYGNQIVHHEQISGVFSRALGDIGYLVRSPDLEEIYKIAEYIQKLS